MNASLPFRKARLFSTVGPLPAGLKQKADRSSAGLGRDAARVLGGALVHRHGSTLGCLVHAQALAGIGRAQVDVARVHRGGEMQAAALVHHQARLVQHLGGTRRLTQGALEARHATHAGQRHLRVAAGEHGARVGDDAQQRGFHGRHRRSDDAEQVGAARFGLLHLDALRAQHVDVGLRGHFGLLERRARRPAPRLSEAASRLRARFGEREMVFMGSLPEVKPECGRKHELGTM